MTLKVLGSSSKGNCYILGNNTECIIMELGVPFPDIKKALDFDISKVQFAFCTHAHGDHSKSVKHAVKMGIKVVMSKGTQQFLKNDSVHIINIAHGETYKSGNFELMAFDTNHDCPGKEPLGFLIRHPECGTVCFITDSFYVDYQFPNVTHFMVEANYCDSIITERLFNDVLHPAQAHRTRQSHMSVDTCKNLLLANNLKKVHNVVLIHLSDGNSDAERFRHTIQKATNCITTVAQKGMELNFNKTPF